MNLISFLLPMETPHSLFLKIISHLIIYVNLYQYFLELNNFRVILYPLLELQRILWYYAFTQNAVTYDYQNICGREGV